MEKQFSDRFGQADPLRQSNREEKKVKKQRKKQINRKRKKEINKKKRKIGRKKKKTRRSMERL